MSDTSPLVHVLVISGLGGSGKTTAIRALEDVGYYCIDNLPATLLESCIELISSRPDITHVAFVIDAREQQFLPEAPETIQRVKSAGFPLDVLFLDARDDTLVRRYSETRRRHPLAGQGSVREGIASERAALEGLSALANVTIDTSALTPHQLKRVITDRYRPTDTEEGLTLNLMSFGFKHGVPVEADLMFDIRFLPNPYFEPNLRPMRGTDRPVQEFVLGQPDAVKFLGYLEDFLDFLLPRYEAEGKRYLTVAIGCTGGHHRSVAVTEHMASKLDEDGRKPRILHRDIDR